MQAGSGFGLLALSHRGRADLHHCSEAGEMIELSLIRQNFAGPTSASLLVYSMGNQRYALPSAPTCPIPGKLKCGAATKAPERVNSASIPRRTAVDLARS